MKKLILLLVVGILQFLQAAVDINNASLKELIKLRGIGKSKAKAIITYRKAHCFESVDELIAVKGIGKKTVEKNKRDIVVGKCK